MNCMLAVASGKGGVGKTWFSISLSHALARMNLRVLLVDCDIGLANVDVQLGLPKAPDLATVALDERLSDEAIRRIDSIGFDVLPGRSGCGRSRGLGPLVIGWLQKKLGSLRQRYDVIILDLPSGVEQGVRDLMLLADQKIVVTTGEPTALADAYALIKATRQNGVGNVPGIVVNFAQQTTSGRQTLDGLIRVCGRFLAIEPIGFGVIRMDKCVPEAIGRQTPLLACHPSCDAAQDVVAVAKVLAHSMRKS
jgi:flagellar biosynthesis protein FlhG